MENNTLKTAIVNQIFLLMKKYPKLVKIHLRGIKVIDCNLEFLYKILDDIMIVLTYGYMEGFINEKL